MMQRVLFTVFLVTLSAVRVLGISNPPYEVYPYLADSTDNPPVNLLKKNPEFADYCDWDKLLGWAWGGLLESQPSFIDSTPPERRNGHYWSGLLTRRPELVDDCPLGTLEGVDWVCILELQPQFADRCAWEKLDGSCWGYLLRERPQFADRCAWEKLDGSCWGYLLRKRPQFADWCPWVRPLEKLLGCTVDADVDWRLPLAIVQKPELFAQENVAARFEGTLILDEDGEWYEDCWESSVIFTDDGESLGCVNPWAFVLYWRPELADRCTTFEKFNGYSRCILLMKQPQFADKWSMEELADRKAACWANLSDNDFKNGWEKLLAAQPQFAKWREGTEGC